MTCGITPAEARHLFPAGALFIPASSDHEAFVISASRLSDALKINPRLLGRGFETMGIARTMWSLFIVCQRSARGEIHATPAAYFNGMVTRAAAGTLDLDRSIWGERQKANKSVMSTAIHPTITSDLPVSAFRSLPNRAHPWMVKIPLTMF
jgi:replication initiation protein RepC